MKREKKLTLFFKQNFSFPFYFILTHPSHSMLYRTQHHQSFLFTFKPFPHSPPSLSPRLLLSSISPLLLQEMECVKGASRGAFGPTTSFMDDFSGATDDLFVDELLDFSSAFSETEQQLEEPEKKEQDVKKIPVSVSEEKQQTVHEISVLSAKEDFGSLPVTELSVPAEGLESLEWLSHFVEDSFPDYSLTGKLPPHKPSENRSEPVPGRSRFSNPVTKARTKRARTGVRAWLVLSESSTSSSSSTSSTTTSFPSPVFWSVSSPKEKSFLTKPPKKKAGSGGVAVQQRRCGHCGVTKTPQWRAGPLGSKTLCNACGVRFKSGRLLPEYRPACSPTFSSELHSNNHRKVLEMRRQKDTGTGAAGPVQSF